MALSFISKMYSVLFLALIFAGHLQAQTIKITKIIDTNLFGLEDGRTVKMAGLITPTKESPGKYMGKFVKDILWYENTFLLNVKLNIVPAGENSADSTSVALVYIKREYSRGSVEFNQRYLELGFGRFCDNVDSLHRDNYKKAEAQAIKYREGLWSFRLIEVKDTLDRKYSLPEIPYYTTQDSIYHIQYLRKNMSPIGWRIAGQTLTGAAGCIVTSYAAGFLGALTFNQRGEWGWLPGAAIGMLVGYSIGGPLGVYLAANSNNPALSFWPTLGFSSLTVAAGCGIALLGPRNNNWLWAIPLLMPVISPIVYVNCIAPNPVTDGADSAGQDLPKYGNTAFKDIYNRSMQFQMNIFSIPF